MIAQCSLKFLTKQRLLGEDELKWTSKLMGLDFKIQFRPGLKNEVADALLRQMMYTGVSMVQPRVWETIEAEIQQDCPMQAIVQGLLHGSIAFFGICLEARTPILSRKSGYSDEIFSDSSPIS